MSLPLSDIVKVDIAVSPTLAPLAGFGEMLFLTEEAGDIEVISLAERQRTFSSLKEVQEAFKDHSTSEVIKAATAFFAQSPTPNTFTVGVGASGTHGGTLMGGAHKDLEAIKALGSAQSITFVEDGKDVQVSNIDMSGVTSLEDVASKVETAFKAVSAASKGTRNAANRSVKYTGGKFVVVAGTSGTSSTIVVKDDNANNPTALAKALGLNSDVAISVAGGDAESLSEALGKIQDVRDTFIAVTLAKQYRDKENYVIAVADWCEANKKIFLNTTNDVKVLTLATQEGTMAKKLKDKALRYTITTFGRDRNEYPSCSLFGRIATVNYEGINTCITLKFKKLPTISALALTSSQKAAMDNLYVGGFMSFGGNLMYAEARMADGGWIDAVHGLLWLEDRIKKGVFNLMYGTTTKIPYTDTGINMVVQKVTSALEQGVRNGLLAAGNTPEGEFLPAGYKIEALSSTEVAAEDKSNRIYRGITFKCIGAGALHNVIISGSFSE